MADILLGGSVGSGGSFPILGKAVVEIVDDTDLVLILAQWANYFLRVTSDGSMTSEHDVVLPLFEGQSYEITNATTEGFPIVAIGATGTGVEIPPGVTAIVVCPDGANYVMLGSSADDASAVWTDINVTDSPFVPGPTDTFIGVDGSDGQVSASFPANPAPGQEYTVKDSFGQAGLNPILVPCVSPNEAEDPNNPGNYAPSVAITSQGGCARWKFDPNANEGGGHWILFSNM